VHDAAHGVLHVNSSKFCGPRKGRWSRVATLIIDARSLEICFAVKSSKDAAAQERLIAADLADKLQVSRTPVREALYLLASEGLVVPTRRGFAVREFTPSEIIEI